MGTCCQGITSDKMHCWRSPLHVLSTSLLAQHLADVMELHSHEAPHLLIRIGYQACQSLMHMCGIPAHKCSTTLLLGHSHSKDDFTTKCRVAITMSMRGQACRLRVNTTGRSYRDICTTMSAPKVACVSNGGQSGTYNLNKAVNQDLRLAKPAVQS